MHNIQICRHFQLIRAGKNIDSPPPEFFLGTPPKIEIQRYAKQRSEIEGFVNEKRVEKRRFRPCTDDVFTPPWSFRLQRRRRSKKPSEEKIRFRFCFRGTRRYCVVNVSDRARRARAVNLNNAHERYLTEWRRDPCAVLYRFVRIIVSTETQRTNTTRVASNDDGINEIVRANNDDNENALLTIVRSESGRDTRALLAISKLVLDSSLPPFDLVCIIIIIIVKFS